MKKKALRVKGKIFFQVSCISWSYRIRGNVARTQIKRAAMSRDLVGMVKLGASGRVVSLGTNTAMVMILMNKMFRYSAMNRRANFPPPNSMLNPETSSDSPSARSKGVRWVSARAHVDQAAAKGGRRIMYGNGSWEIKKEKSKVFLDRRALSKIRLIVTS